MPRTKKQNEPEVESQFVPSEDELEAALANLPSEEKSLSLWRMHTEGGRPKFLRQLAPAEFTLNAVQEEFGGGRFKLEIKDGAQKWAQVFEIEGPSRFAGTVPDRAAPPAVDSSSSPLVQTLLLELRELKNQIAASQQNVFTQSLIEKLLTREPESEEKFLARLATYRQLFAQPQTSVDHQTIFGVLKEGIALGAEGGGGAAPNPWLALAERVLPMITQALTAHAPGPPAAEFLPGDVQPLPVPIIPNGAPTMPTNPASGFQAIAPRLQPFVPTFVAAAAADTDPQIMVELVRSNLPADAVPQVLDWLQSPRWFDDLSTLNPHIGAQRSWWNEFREALLNSYMKPAVDGGKDD